MATYVLRIWLPDRPGGLGAVASRVGAVGGDVIGIEIIERGAGRAVDELVVVIPEEKLLDLLLQEINQVDGVDIENVRPLDGLPADTAVMSLDAARDLQLAGTVAERCGVLVDRLIPLVGADWAAVVDVADGHVTASSGDGLPAHGWIVAFASGVATGSEPPDVPELATGAIASGGLVVVGRPNAPLRGRERDLIRALSRLA
ncbi:MAG: ACT domain-containing protein [Actinomycetota bacterium]